MREEGEGYGNGAGDEEKAKEKKKKKTRACVPQVKTGEHGIKSEPTS